MIRLNTLFVEGTQQFANFAVQVFYLRKLFSKFIKLQTVTDAGEGSDIASSPENKIFHVIPLQSAEKAWNFNRLH